MTIAWANCNVNDSGMHQVSKQQKSSMSKAWNICSYSSEQNKMKEKVFSNSHSLVEYFEFNTVATHQSYPMNIHPVCSRNLAKQRQPISFD